MSVEDAFKEGSAQSRKSTENARSELDCRNLDARLEREYKIKEEANKIILSKNKMIKICDNVETLLYNNEKIAIALRKNWYVPIFININFEHVIEVSRKINGDEILKFLITCDRDKILEQENYYAIWSENSDGAVDGVYSIKQAFVSEDLYEEDVFRELGAWVERHPAWKFEGISFIHKPISQPKIIEYKKSDYDKYKITGKRAIESTIFGLIIYPMILIIILAYLLS